MLMTNDFATGAAGMTKDKGIVTQRCSEACVIGRRRRRRSSFVVGASR